MYLCDNWNANKLLCSECSTSEWNLLIQWSGHTLYSQEWCSPHWFPRTLAVPSWRDSERGGSKSTLFWIRDVLSKLLKACACVCIYLLSARSLFFRALSRFCSCSSSFSHSSFWGGKTKQTTNLSVLENISFKMFCLLVFVSNLNARLIPLKCACYLIYIFLNQTVSESDHI